MALTFSTFLWPLEPLSQYPCVRAQDTSVQNEGSLLAALCLSDEN